MYFRCFHYLRYLQPPWGNEDTQELIDILDRFQVKATFFVVGDWVDKYPESVKALHDAGHEVMNHSNTHAHYPQLSPQAVVDDLNACNDKIEAVTGVRPTLVRLPYGDYDDNAIRAVRSIGMEPIQWDVDSLDWKELPAQEIAQRCHNITVVSNNLAAVRMLLQAPAIRVILIGGNVDPTEQSTYGPMCEQGFVQYYPDVTFLSLNAVNYKDGFTDFRLSEVGIIRALSEHSRRVIAVMDSSKLGKRSKCKVLDLDAVERLLMDDQVAEGVREKYREKGILIE